MSRGFCQRVGFPVSPLTGRYTWRYLDRILGDKILLPPDAARSRGNFATACDVENNGETVVVGYRDGSLHLWAFFSLLTGSFNIQSGLYRGSLPRESKPGFRLRAGLTGFLAAGAQPAGEGGHTEAVLAAGIDLTGQVGVPRGDEA